MATTDRVVMRNRDDHARRRDESVAGSAVLFADGDEAMRWVVRDVLESEGFRVLLAADGQEAVALLTECAPDVVVTDPRMPDGGLEMIARLRSASPSTPIILITAFGDVKVQARALSLGIAACFNKPVRMAALKEAIRCLLRGSSGEGPP